MSDDQTKPLSSEEIRKLLRRGREIRDKLDEPLRRMSEWWRDD